MAATKGLGKLNDYVTERFDGTDPGEFSSFMQQFDLGVDTLEIHTTKQHLLLLNCLAGRPRDLAVKKLSEFKEAHPLLTTGNAAQKLTLSVQLLRELKELLKSSPLVVGARPSEKAYELWGKLTQGANEKVRNYHHRFYKLEERLRTSEPPMAFPEMARFSIFVGQTEATGLRPELQRHVKLQAGDTVEQAYAAAQRYEDVSPANDTVVGATHAVRWPEHLRVYSTTQDFDQGPSDAEPESEAEFSRSCHGSKDMHASSDEESCTSKGYPSNYEGDGKQTNSRAAAQERLLPNAHIFNREARRKAIQTYSNEDLIPKSA